MRRPRDGFFLRAESFYNVATEIEKLDPQSSIGVPVVNSYGGIATHSPILMAYPGADIFVSDDDGITKTPYKKLIIT